MSLEVTGGCMCRPLGAVNRRSHGRCSALGASHELGHIGREPSEGFVVGVGGQEGKRGVGGEHEAAAVEVGFDSFTTR